MSNTLTANMTWFAACRTTDVPHNGGVCVKYKTEQIALFYFARRDEWYATQNKCPHRQQMALSRGMEPSIWRNRSPCWCKVWMLAIRPSV